MSMHNVAESGNTIPMLTVRHRQTGETTRAVRFFTRTWTLAQCQNYGLTYDDGWQGWVRPYDSTKWYLQSGDYLVEDQNEPEGWKPYGPYGFNREYEIIIDRS